jgi:hypothetical protein
MEQRLSHRAWELGGGQPVRVPRGRFGAERVVFSAGNPFHLTYPESIALTNLSGTFTARIWGLDPRHRLVVTPFFRPAGWWQAESGVPRTGIDWSLREAEGANYLTHTVEAWMVRKDSQTGNVHRIGKLDAEAWLNSGTIPDGIEIETAGYGVEIVITASINPIYVFQGEGGWVVTNNVGAVLDTGSINTWDIVCSFEVVPNQILGCNGMADEVIQALHPEYSEPIELIYGGQEGG